MLQKIPVPLNGDEAAVSKFVNEVEALKQKVRRFPSCEEDTCNFTLLILLRTFVAILHIICNTRLPSLNRSLA